MGCRLNRIAVVLLAVVAVCSCQSLRPPATSPSAKSLEIERGIGLIEHRRKFYRLEDLMDPAYRAASNDKFVRDFGESNFAEVWAGINPEEELPLKRVNYFPPRLAPRVCAGLNAADHSEP